MEDSQNAQSGNSAGPKLQRYPLRSGAKSKEASSELSSSKSRVRATSSVSKSVSVLNLSGNAKPAKPPRRLSIPSKSSATSNSRPPRNDITPISEVRPKRTLLSAQKKPDTPISDILRSSTRKKFSVLSSSSYWLSQIKLSESASKHAISLGFFKLALEAGCEPLQKMRDELTLYTRRHNLEEELGESVKELSESYNVAKDSSVQVQVSETCSRVPEEETRSSEDEIRSASSVSSIKKPKPSVTAKPVTLPTESIKKDLGQKKANSATNTVRASLTKTSANSRSLPDAGVNKSAVKKTQKPIKREANKEKDLTKQRGKKSTIDEGSVSPSATEITLQENKENMECSSMEVAGVTEVV